MLKIDTVYKKGILFVRLYGAINNENVEEIKKVLEVSINKVGIKYLLLNFENIYYTNANITSLLKKYSEMLIKKEGKLFICGYEPLIKEKTIKINNDICKIQNEFSAFNLINI